jgi:hypothetical protein
MSNANVAAVRITVSMCLILFISFGFIELIIHFSDAKIATAG